MLSKTRKYRSECRSRDKLRGKGKRVDARQPLPLFDPKTSSRHSYDRVGDVVQLQKVNDGVDVGESLLLRRRTRLPEHSAELESLSDGRLREMDVDLEAEASGSLERKRKGLTVDEDWRRKDKGQPKFERAREKDVTELTFSLQLSLVLPLGETVEKSRLPGSRRSH